MWDPEEGDANELIKDAIFCFKDTNNFVAACRVQGLTLVVNQKIKSTFTLLGKSKKPTKQSKGPNYHLLHSKID